MKNPYKNFQAPIHLACSRDELKPDLQYVFFEEGYIWATNGVILARQSLKAIHGFSKEEVDMLEGKRLHSSVFKAILGHYIIEIKEDRIDAHLGTEIISYWYSKNQDKAPDYKHAVRSSVEFSNPVSQIGINAKLISTVDKIMVYNMEGYISLTFTEQNKAIFIGTPNYKLKDQFCLLMPVMLNMYEPDNIKEII